MVSSQTAEGQSVRYVRVFRHLESVRTTRKREMIQSKVYQEMVASLNIDPFSLKTHLLAAQVNSEFPGSGGDESVPLAHGEFERGIQIGQVLSARYQAGEIELPDLIVISPAKRTRETFLSIVSGFPELNSKIQEHPDMVVEDPRVRERNQGGSVNYADTKVYYGLTPQVLADSRRLGRRANFDFRIPGGGENIPDVMRRAREWDEQRDPNNNVWVFTHHQFNLVYRVLQEGFNENQVEAADRFLELDAHEMPPTGSMTTFEVIVPDPTQRRRSRLILRSANEEIVSQH